MRYDSLNEQFPFINFEFILHLEDPLYLDGWVPSSENNSGVTIAAGFDIGAQNENDLRSLKLNPTLIGKLYPYLGKKGQDALVYLSKFPLSISEHEASAIDAGVKLQRINKLIKCYDEKSHIRFSELPQCWQTVIVSIACQYADLEIRFSTFWECITTQNWNAALNELGNLSHTDGTRRNIEADYIQKYS